MIKARALAFYLPQYHPIEENDKAWGKGFTEWHNVAKARPLFRGHHQPRRPTELGYYDLRLPEVRAEQARLARQYGIEGFVYYHYWFDGRRVLERPFDEVLESREPDLPFALCWANENWTRRWDGGSQEVVVAQNYNPSDVDKHFEYLLRAFQDDRYIKVDDRPIFLIYRPSEIPDVASMNQRWRELAHAAGLPGLYLCCVESGSNSTDPVLDGFDAAVEFQPRFRELQRSTVRNNRYFRLASRWGLLPERFRHTRISYERIVRASEADRETSYPRHRSVFPSWDNTARRATGGTIVTGANPETYERWLRTIVQRAVSSTVEPLVFINAWNEWAEGAYLEPDARNGRAYLEATERALNSRVQSYGKHA